MKTNYTYEDVMKRAAEYGLLDSMSEADRNLSMTDPDAGMTILNSRNDYRNATTDQGRAMAHAMAERTRRHYGGYSGGADGSSFYVEVKAPTFQNQYADRQNELTDAILNRKEYTSSYDEEQKALLEQIKDTADFTYDPESDPAYGTYAKQYRREGQRAAAHALGEAAMMTGGVPSSAAVSAAAQAGQYYAAQFSDRLPSLMEAAYARNADRQAMLLKALEANNAADDRAYQRYLNEAALRYDDLEMLRAMESDDYQQYRDTLAQFNTDRDFDYDRYIDGRYDKELALREEQYQTELDAMEDEKRWTAALYALEYLNDSSLLKQLIAEMKGAS
ncbi:MAG: hypothetical protein IIY02_03785 [Firmicutes bacterium]|nr:hypothetical protein [Bacillota bacterium]